MHREPKPSRAILSAPFPPSPPHLPSPAVAASSTPSSSHSSRRFKRFRSLLPTTTTTSYRAVLSSVCIMAVLFWVIHLLFFSLFPDFTTGNPSTSPSSPIPPPSSPSSPQEEPSVADLALQKILKDSRQILGPFPSSFNKSAAAKRRAQWMTPLPDSLPLTSLKAIPGTHDSATWNFTQATRDAIPSNPSYLPADWFRCQKKSIVESLEAGIRFFDLRYAALEDGGKKGEEGMRLVFWHKMALLSEVATVEDVLFGFYGWLETRGKGETVLISLQYEHPTRSKASNTPQVQRLLHSTLTTPAARRFIYPSHSLPPTLGHARGKIVLLKRFDLPDLSLDQQLAVPGLNFSPSLWPENNKGFELVYNQLDLGPGEGEGKKMNETAYIEDYFEPNDLPNKMNGSVEENVAAKWEAVEEHLRSAAAASQRSEGEDDGLWITFTSGEHVLNEPNITPEVMALGPEEQRRGQPGRKVDGGKGGGGTVKGGVNEKLLGLLKEGGPDGLKGKRLGVVVMDFWEMEGEGDLIGALLGLD